MTRRLAAGVVAAVGVVALTLLLFLLPVPYAILGPGPVCNTVGDGNGNCPATTGDSLISVSPASADHPSGSTLGFTTVAIPFGEPSLASALGAWFSRSRAVVPVEEVKAPGQKQSAVDRKSAQQMSDAQDAAVTAAEAQLHLLTVSVASVTAGSAAAGVLQTGDVLTAVDGTAVTSADQLLSLTASTDTAHKFALAIIRAGSSRTVTLAKTRSGDGTLKFGIAIRQDPRGGLRVRITLDPRVIGGPSAGLMFTLGILDRLTPGDLTGGKTVVAGTGTMDALGTVGPIGGIQQKLYAARHDFHAKVFLAPAGDCGDARGAIPSGLQVVKVSTLSGALTALAAVRSGRTSDLPHC